MLPLETNKNKIEDIKVCPQATQPKPKNVKIVPKTDNQLVFSVLAFGSL
jgi:hypothetical protein